MSANQYRTVQELAEEAIIAPDAIVAGVAVQSSRAYEPNGVGHPVVILSILFQIQDGGQLAQQTFIMDDETADYLRRDLKNPPALKTQDTPDKEEA